MRTETNMKSLTTAVFALLVTFVMAASAGATIISGAVTGGSAFIKGGVFEKLFPPIGKVGKNNHQSNNLFAFDEMQNITLDKVLKVNIGSNIAKGTVISSHYVFFDPGKTRKVKGYVEFDSDILAIITGRHKLKKSDYLGEPSAKYKNPIFRGLEWIDHVEIDLFDPRKIDIDFFRASSPGDYIRVITGASPVPEPGTLILLGAGMTGLYGFRRAGRNRKN